METAAWKRYEQADNEPEKEFDGLMSDSGGIVYSGTSTAKARHRMSYRIIRIANADNPIGLNHSPLRQEHEAGRSLTGLIFH